MLRPRRIFRSSGSPAMSRTLRRVLLSGAGLLAAIVAAVAGCDERAAFAALEKTGGQVKPAILIATGAADAKAAKELLDGTGGRLRPALSKIAALEGSGPKR